MHAAHAKRLHPAASPPSTCSESISAEMPATAEAAATNLLSDLLEQPINDTLLLRALGIPKSETIRKVTMEVCAPSEPTLCRPTLSPPRARRR